MLCCVIVVVVAVVVLFGVVVGVCVVSGDVEGVYAGIRVCVTGVVGGDVQVRTDCFDGVVNCCVSVPVVMCVVYVGCMSARNVGMVSDVGGVRDVRDC